MTERNCRLDDLARIVTDMLFREPRANHPGRSHDQKERGHDR